ncbi:MAG: endonuclease/exonuclease/phosphatase family protein [Caulobacteraceae bacterium]|nr:endonuclease/exonuclease/phosphatase family protein [Caulobacteraceae bacterium]
MLRLLTYNVHRCVGTDGRHDVGRIAAVIAAEAPDIVALQEVDVGRARTGKVDQAHEIARRLNMTPRFHAALRVEEELYGDAILTSLPHTVVKAGPLPGYPAAPMLEPRGALWLSFDLGKGRCLQVLNTHLGLVPREQQLQAAALVGEQWLGGALRQDPFILTGDFNAGPRSRVYAQFAHVLRNAHDFATHGPRRVATFPSRLPVLRIDHMFVSSGVRILGLRAGMTALARTASDHLPLVADIMTHA